MTSQFASRRPGPVLVTGANGGIGLATVIELARRGWDTWGTVRTEAAATVVEGAAIAHDLVGQIHPIVLDVSNHDAIRSSWRELPDFYGVVNNAGYSEVGAVEEVSVEAALSLLSLNVVTPALIASLSLPGMRRLGGGRVVMLSSVAGRFAVIPLNAWYQASKFALEALSDVLRLEVSSSGITVSVIQPGRFRTELERKVVRAAESRSGGASPYSASYVRMARVLRRVEKVTPGPSRVGRVIVKAIESRRPARRYLVGFDARLLAAMQPILRGGLVDPLIKKVARLERSQQALRAK